MQEFLIGIGALVVLAGILAAFLELADRFLADYGERQITINQEKQVTVQGGKSLLAALMDEKIFIPSACGGRGTCGYCKVKVLEGGGPVLPTETPYLTKEDLENHVRLSCQVKVRNDLVIWIPEEIFLVKEYVARVASVEPLTPRIKALKLEILEPTEGITFKPGQYVQLEVPKYELTKGPEYRAYSIASSARKRHELELVITKVPEGAVSTYVHDFLKQGDTLRLSGPYGDFYLRPSERDILFIATGSGLAPILSMLDQLASEGGERKVTLFFGARTRKDLYYEDRIERIQDSLPQFNYIFSLSRPTEEDRWEGEKGRVTNLIEKYVDQGAQLDVYMCGAPQMVESCKKLLLKKGIPEEQMFYDTFD